MAIKANATAIHNESRPKVKRCLLKVVIFFTRLSYGQDSGTEAGLKRILYSPFYSACLHKGNDHKVQKEHEEGKIGGYNTPMPQSLPGDLEDLIDGVILSPRYQDIDPKFVKRVAEEELGKRRNTKEAVKATKNKLHQVVGAYLEDKPKYSDWLETLRLASASPNPSDFQTACRQIMAHHASTRERLPILDDFFQQALAGIPKPRSVLDVACGLNPLAIPWMPLAPQPSYIAIDVVGDLMHFLDEFFKLAPVRGQAIQADILSTLVMRTSPASESVIEFQPTGVFDLALVLKTIPCLEQVDKTAGQRILELLPARYLLVSFPGRSLGGRAKGMVENYEAHFRDLIKGKDWKLKRHEFPGELAFLIDKTGFSE